MSWQMRVLLGAIFKWKGLKLIISRVIYTVEAGMDRGSSEMDYDADSGKGTAAFNSRCEFEIPPQMNPFPSDCEHMRRMLTKRREDHGPLTFFL